MKIFTTIRSIAFIAIAIVSFCFAISIEDMSVGRDVSSYQYGGDAYTGIQNAAAETGCNVYQVAQIERKGFEFIFILTGLGFLAVGLTPVCTNSVACTKKDEKIKPQNSSTSEAQA